METAPSLELPDPSETVQHTVAEQTPISLPDGSFIVIEGIDGAGKSTVLGALAHALDEDEFTITTEPDDSTVYGQAVRHAIKDDETPPLSVFFLFLADHANHYYTKVQPALDEGDVVVCDRYIDSRYAYQSYALEDAVADPVPWLGQLDHHLQTSEYPRITVSNDIADAPPETHLFVALARVFADDEVLHPAMRATEDGQTVNIVDTMAQADSPLESVARDPLNWLSSVTDYDDTLSWIQSIQEHNSWSQLPDQTLLIDIDVETSFERKTDDAKETFEKRGFLTAVRENYHDLAGTEPRFTVIDGEQTPAAVVEATLTALVNDLNPEQSL